MRKEDIKNCLPYAKPFLFVDDIVSISEQSVVGTYKYDASSDFYKGHLKNYPITPGVILIETMAQIGLVCLGIYLLKEEITPATKVFMSNANVNFLKPVFPDEKVTVYSELQYFRFRKIKCKVLMKNEQNEVVCQGFIEGFVNNKSDEE